LDVSSAIKIVSENYKVCEKKEHEYLIPKTKFIIMAIDQVHFNILENILKDTLSISNLQ